MEELLTNWLIIWVKEYLGHEIIKPKIVVAESEIYVGNIMKSDKHEEYADKLMDEAEEYLKSLGFDYSIFISDPIYIYDLDRSIVDIKFSHCTIRLKVNKKYNLSNGKGFLMDNLLFLKIKYEDDRILNYPFNIFKEGLSVSMIEFYKEDYTTYSVNDECKIITSVTLENAITYLCNVFNDEYYIWCLMERCVPYD